MPLVKEDVHEKDVENRRPEISHLQPNTSGVSLGTTTCTIRQSRAPMRSN